MSLFSVLILAGCEQELQQPSFQFTVNNPSETGSQYPNLHTDSSGMVTMSWLSGIEEDLYALEFSTFNEGRWTPSRTVNLSRDYFVNWADFPSVVSQQGEVVAAHWLRKKEGGPYAYEVNIVFPTDTARRWTDPVVPHSDETATEHGFVSMEPLAGNRMLAIWLDGRNTEDREHDEYDDPEKAMTLRSAEISRDGSISREQEIDAMVCDCCQTDMIRTENEALAVFRNRTEDEIRDISIVSYDTESGEWSEPRTVHEDGWQINGCPVNGPRIDHNGEHTAVSWYTEADDSSQVKLSVSDNGGEFFGEPITIAGQRTLGRTDVAIAGDGTIYTSWLERRENNGNGYVMMRSLSPDGELSEPVQVGITTSTRQSGFPRMAATEEGILLAWTQTDPVYRVRTALVRYDYDPELN